MMAIFCNYACDGYLAKSSNGKKCPRAETGWPISERRGAGSGLPTRGLGALLGSGLARWRRGQRERGRVKALVRDERRYSARSRASRGRRRWTWQRAARRRGVAEADAKAGGMGDTDPGGGARRGPVPCRIEAEAAPWLLLKPEEKKAREGIQRGNREGKLGATAG